MTPRGAGAGGHPRRRPGIRVALLGVEAFVAVTAIGGGLALAAGLEGGRFPTAWLAGTPFADYALPGLLLAGVVGGSAAVAFVALLRARPAPAGQVSVAAGLVLCGWIAGELLLLTADGTLVSPTEVVYLGLGVAGIVLGEGYRRENRAERRA